MIDLDFFSNGRPTLLLAVILQPKSTMPTTKKITYTGIVSDIIHHKKETHIVCITVVSNLQDYVDDTSSPTVSIITPKILFNSAVPTIDIKFLGLDIYIYIYIYVYIYIGFYIFKYYLHTKLHNYQ